jgi:hypothetical protein
MIMDDFLLLFLSDFKPQAWLTDEDNAGPMIWASTWRFETELPRPKHVWASLWGLQVEPNQINCWAKNGLRNGFLRLFVEA